MKEGKKEAGEEAKQAKWSASKNEIPHEPISESAPTWANGSEEGKPEGEGRHESQPDLDGLETNAGKKGMMRCGAGVNPDVF